MRVLDKPSLTWVEWNKNKPKKQFDREKFTALSIVEKNEKIRNLINDMVDHILLISNPVKILLFGSRARQNAKPDSDIDIVVIFKRKRDITRKYYNLINKLKDTSPIDVDFKSASRQHINISRENISDFYYYVMHDTIILYQQDDGDLYEFLKKAHMFLDLSYDSQKLKTDSGLGPYIVIKQSLGAVFLAGYRPMPTDMSSLVKIAGQLPNWKVCDVCNKDELDYITKLVKPVFGVDNDKDPYKSYKIAKKIYESVLEECMKRNLLSNTQIKNLRFKPRLVKDIN